MKKHTAMLMALLLFLSPLSCGRTEEKFTTTVMVYMCGSNLESQYGLATRDITEMMGSGLDRFSTNVVIMAGGASQWASTPLTEGQSGIYQLRGNSFYTLWQGEGKNMGAGETLSFFLNTAYEKFNTDRYMLVFWNHGGGPIQGVCWDENFDKDSLQIPELIRGIEESSFRERKLDLIGFDACLMGSVETAWQLSDYAHLMIASEETEPGGGWDYSFLKGMETEALSQTARRLIDLYIDTASHSQGAPLTLSLIDLDQMDGVVSAMDQYFSDLGGEMNEDLFQDLSGLRYHAQAFGRDYRAAESNDYDLVDIMSLLDSFQNHSREAAQQLRQELQQAILYHRSTYETSFGLSIYFPYFNRQSYMDTGKAAYEKLNFCPGYTDFIDTFHQQMMAVSGVDWQNLTPVVMPAETGFQITLPLTEAQQQNLVSARLMIFESAAAPGSRNAYFDQVYGSAAVALSPEGQLTADYDDECLIFEYHTANGLMRRSSSIPFTLLDNGDYRVEVMAANLKPDYILEAKEDEPGVSHRMQFTLSPSRTEENLMEISQIQVWDSMTQTFTSRTDDKPENYEYLYLQSNQRMLTLEDGLILPYGRWNTRDEFDLALYSSYAAVTDSQWYFRTVKEADQIRYAAFEITDIYNRTFTTNLALIRPEEQVLLYHAPFVLDAPALEMDCKIFAVSPYSVRLMVCMTNPSDQLYFFNLENVFLNGEACKDLDDSSVTSAKPLYPHSMCSAAIGFDILDVFDIAKANVGQPSGQIQSIQLDLALYEGMREKYLGSIENITLQPELDFQTLPLIFE